MGDKGEWAKTSEDGIVPVENDESDAVLGRTTGSDEPATEGGDQADATTDGGPDVPEDAEPDLKDVGAAQRDDAR